MSAESIAKALVRAAEGLVRLVALWDSRSVRLGALLLVSLSVGVVGAGVAVLGAAVAAESAGR